MDGKRRRHRREDLLSIRCSKGWGKGPGDGVPVGDREGTLSGDSTSSCKVSIDHGEMELLDTSGDSCPLVPEDL